MSKYPKVEFVFGVRHDTRTAVMTFGKNSPRQDLIDEITEKTAQVIANTMKSSVKVFADGKPYTISPNGEEFARKES